MYDNEIVLEIPFGISDEDLNNLQKALDSASDVNKVKLRRSRDIVGTITLAVGLIPVAATYIKQVAEVAQNIKSSAKILHDFLHPADKKTEAETTARESVKIVQADGNKTSIFSYTESELAELIIKFNKDNNLH